MRLISGVTTIPQRILMGSERGELASIQDRNNWNDRVAERRKTLAEPAVRTFVDALIEKSAVPKPKEYVIKWGEVEELSEDEKGELAERYARANHANSRAGGRLVITNDEIRQRVWGMEPIGAAGEPDLPTPPVDPNVPDDDDDDDADIDVDGADAGDGSENRSDGADDTDAEA
jgi:hypothetical protein